MNTSECSEDLIILTPDKNTHYALEGILNRPSDLGIRKIRHKTIVYSDRDPGVFRKAHDFLRSYQRSAQYALVILDREGCGAEHLSAEAIENSIEENLARNGWSGRSAAIAIDPELETWVWTSSSYVPRVLGWSGDYTSLEGWLREKGFVQSGSRKPSRPKEAMEEVLRQAKIPRSSSLYKELAEKVRFEECRDRAFCKLRSTLHRWFPPES